MVGVGVVGVGVVGVEVVGVGVVGVGVVGAGVVGGAGDVAEASLTVIRATIPVPGSVVSHFCSPSLR